MSARREGQLMGALGLLTCLLAGTVIAQQATEEGTRRDQIRENRAERLEQRDLQQNRDRTARRDELLEEGQNRATREFDKARNEQGSAADVDRFWAFCLLAKNEAEISLSKIALDKSQNEQVRQFAQMLVDDHTKAVQKLQPLAAKSAGTGAEQLNQQTGSTINQLIKLEHAIASEHTNRVREKLQEAPADEFDACFLGFQVGAHTGMSAALGVLEKQASGKVRQLAASMKPTVDHHLQEAEKLMEQAKNSSAQATRTETGRTAR